MKEKMIPEIRFKGFTDTWEQRKLGDISEKVTLKNKDNRFDETLTNSAEFGIISQNEFFDKEISNRSNLDGYYVVENNNFVYNPRISNFAPVGPVKRNKLGRTGVMSPLYYVFKTRNIDNDFLEKYFDTTYWHIFMKLNGDSGARADRFAIKDSVFKEMPIPFPKLEEQTKIGNFFKQLDDTITLQERKVNLLKEQKKGYLQKMFPKQNEKFPELRFEGFTDAWEQRKLSEVFNQTVEYVDPKEANLELWSVTVEKGLTPKTERYNREALVKKNDKFKVVHPGDIVYNPMNMTIGSVGFNKTNQNVAVSGYYVTMNMNPGFSNSYFNTWLPSAQAIRIYKLYATGSLIEKQRIQFPTLSSIRIPIPTFEESERIGQFFDNLEDAIALQEQKLEQMKEMKKGFLQKLFV
ncbi:restriction endonuclease subunit S [Vagococcus fluvialis]|uniref:restriction endonuclease subunit S n=1 Tax=Vagococcus fluvialis TaxID=2738 RepID=UPI003B2137C4